MIAGEFDRSVLGAEGQGYVWNDRWEDTGDDSEEDPRQKLVRSIGFLPQDAEVARPDVDDVNDDADTISEVLEDSDFGDEDGEYGSGYETEDELIKHLLEAEDTVHRGINENHTVDNVVLELNALKMGMPLIIRRE
jgi:hypothetical protein